MVVEVNLMELLVVELLDKVMQEELQEEIMVVAVAEVQVILDILVR